MFVLIVEYSAGNNICEQEDIFFLLKKSLVGLPYVYIYCNYIGLSYLYIVAYK